jgi:hypothetical protein
MRHPWTWLLVVVLSIVAAAEAPPHSEVDWASVAKLVVNRSFALAPGERVVIFWDRTADRGAAAAIRTAILERGAVIVGQIDVASPADATAREQLFADADAAIWLPTRTLPEHPFEHLVERSKVRSIHFHWFLPPDAALADRIDLMYAQAIAVAPAELSVLETGLESALAGAKLSLSSPNGTALRFEIPRQARFHRNTGDASRAKVEGARSVRDREEELPASVVRTTELRNVSGTLVGYPTMDTNGPLLKATFRHGKVEKLESLRAAESIVAAWERATGDKALPAELVISTNPALEPVLPGGFMPYYGYGAGIVRVTIGDNWESGGKNRSPLGETLFFLTDATLEADGKVLVQAGRLVGK